MIKGKESKTALQAHQKGKEKGDKVISTPTILQIILLVIIIIN